VVKGLGLDADRTNTLISKMQRGIRLVEEPWV
jgi:hypothetical protein